MIIFHGENTVQSRKRLGEVLDAGRATGKQVVRVETKLLEKSGLETAIGSDTLFGDSKIILIEELHSLPKSKRKDELIHFLEQAATNKIAEPQIILWEKKELTPTMLKKFVAAGAKVEYFKLTSTLFKWLDSIKSIALLRAAIDQDGDMMCFTMLIRQVRFLLEIKEGGTPKLAPFMVTKLRQQAGTFSEQKLREMHHRLLEIDVAQKTSNSWLNVAEQLELLIISL